MADETTPPEDETPEVETPEADDTQQVEEITILSLSGARRVLVPALNDYRDIGSGGSEIAALVIDDRDPAYAFMREWAEKTPDVEIHGIKKGVRVCPICSIAIGSASELADHAEEVHIDNGEEEETGRPRTRAGAKAVAERKERSERVRRATGER